VLKILFVIPELDYSGAGKQLLLLATGLPRPEFEVRVAVFGRAGPLAERLRAGGVAVEVLGWTRLIDINPLRRLRQLVAMYQPNVIHTWRWPSLWAAYLAAGRNSRRLVVGQARLSQASKAIRSRWERWLLGRADAIVTSGLAEADHCRQVGLLKEKVVVIPPGVASMTIPESTQAELYRSLRLPANARLVMGVGPLETRKGFQDAIWTLDILKYLYDDLHLVLIGNGSERLRLQQFAQAVGASANIHFAGPQVDVPVLLVQSEVVWVPSYTSGGVNVALEAMAAGRPVVASRLPMLAEIVAEGETGFLITRGDKVAWARQTRLLLDDPERRRRMGEAGRRRVEQYFPTAKMVDSYVRLYESVSGEW
jgi:glycosyltransferase involved in cell wall biosynthesis